MNRRSYLSWQIAFTYIGAIVGAGFASGQELLRFFAKFGYWGVLGALLAGLLLALVGLAVVKAAVRLHLDSYEQYLQFLFGPRRAKVFDGLVCFFLWCGLAVMLVAGGSLFHQLFGWPLEKGFLLNAVLLYLVLLAGVKGMLWLNSCLIPGLLVLSLIAAGGGIIYGGEILPHPPGEGGIPLDNWFIAAILYVSYNLVLSMVILVALGKAAQEGGGTGVIVGGVALGFLAAALSLALSKNSGLIQGKDLPLLALAQALGSWLGKCYSFVLWAAIFTTALSNGLGLLKRLEGFHIGAKPLIAIGIFLPTLLLLGWPLSKAVGVLYPILGYLGLILFAAIVLQSKSNK